MLKLFCDSIDMVFSNSKSTMAVPTDPGMTEKNSIAESLPET